MSCKKQTGFIDMQTAKAQHAHAPIILVQKSGASTSISLPSTCETKQAFENEEGARVATTSFPFPSHSFSFLSISRVSLASHPVCVSIPRPVRRAPGERDRTGRAPLLHVWLSASPCLSSICLSSPC